MRIKSFIESNFLIDDARSGEMVPFKFNAVQDKYFAQLVNDYGEDFYENASVRELIIKARKEGFTSLILAIFATVMVWQGKRFLEISYRIDTTKQHFRRLKNYLLSGLTHDIKKWDGGLERLMFASITEGSELVLRDNLASFYCGTATSRTGERGGTVQGVLFTESAHYPDTGIQKASEIIEGTRNMVAVDSGMIFQETTANGFNHTKKTWDMAVQKLVDYKPRFYGWKEFYTPEQFEKIKLGFTDKNLIQQEFPVTVEEAFLHSGRPAFNQNTLSIIAKKVSGPVYCGELVSDSVQVKLVELDSGSLKVWKVPRHQRRYIVTADVAEGVKGGDYSVAQVLDRMSWEQVAVCRCHISPGEFGKVLVNMAKYYNNGLIIPEINNHGWATVERIHAEGYPHLFRTKDIWQNEAEDKDGFPTNVKTRGLIIDAMKGALDELTIIINDAVTLGELQTAIVDDSGKVCAPEGYYDDCLMSLAIGVYCLKYYTMDETYKDKEFNLQTYFVNPMWDINAKRGRYQHDRLASAHR